MQVWHVAEMQVWHAAEMHMCHVVNKNAHVRHEAEMQVWHVAEMQVWHAAEIHMCHVVKKCTCEACGRNAGVACALVMITAGEYHVRGSIIYGASRGQNKPRHSVLTLQRYRDMQKATERLL
jgi:hypothetical protein